MKITEDFLFLCLLKYNGCIRDYLIKNGYQPEYGARPVNRLIRRDILSEVSKYMLENPEMESIHIDYNNGVIVSG